MSFLFLCLFYLTGNALRHHTGHKFSTKDQDNDVWAAGNCSGRHKGAWWYNGCQFSNLNGVYRTSNPSTEKDGLQWYDWKGHYYSLKTTEMKIRMV